MKFGIVRFPGSNCEMDCYQAITRNLKQPALHLWHKERDLGDCDCIVLPGGFSYGDYLRAGAMASLSPIIASVVAFANKGGYVIGICNGFQILTECGLLPGALMRNRDLRFVCRFQHLQVVNNTTAFTGRYGSNHIINIPIAHGEGNYQADSDVLDSLFEHGQVVFQYCDEDGNINSVTCPNGSCRNIAGIVNKQGNVLGMMPHPERVCDPHLGGSDGLDFFRSLIEYLD